MKTTHAFCAMLAFTLMAGALGSSCSHKQVKPDDATLAAIDDKNIKSSDLGNAMGLKTIHFDFDSPLLDTGGKRTLSENVQVLKDHPSIRIQVEGHCDARGGIQYNIALGEKRAHAVKHYLTDHGIESARIATISYGKERPLDSAQSEEAYAKNRRAAFVITTQ